MIKDRCDVCITDKSRCAECCENPIYANVPTQSLFQAYVPTCPRCGAHMRGKKMEDRCVFAERSSQKVCLLKG